MTRLYAFADEAGDFTFTRHVRASRYFIVCTIWLESCAIGNELMALRRELAWKKLPLGEYFHASEDKQAVRDAVFDLIKSHKLEVHATIMEKCKAMPRVRESNARFYQYGWLYHFKYGAPRAIRPENELLITAASVAKRKAQVAFTDAVHDVVGQTMGRNQWATNFCPAAADPCIQIADYCTWAIQRKWERDDSRSFDLIKHHVTYEYDLWKKGRTLYY